MGIGWIDQVYNNSAETWCWRSVDSVHNGEVTNTRNGSHYVLDGGEPEGVGPEHQVHGGMVRHTLVRERDPVQGGVTEPIFIPRWPDPAQAHPVRDVGTRRSQLHRVHGWPDRSAGRSADSPKGGRLPLQLRFEEEGPYIDILNDDGTTAEFLAQVNDLQKGWVDEATKVLAVLLKAMSGGGGGGGN